MATTLTNTGRSKLLVATPLAPVTIISMAFGDGGGSLPVVDPARTNLVNELIRVDCTNPVRDTTDPTIIALSGYVPRTFGGVTLREFGIFDNTGALIAYGTINNQVIETPTSEYGFTYVGTIRVKLDNVTMTTVVNSDAPAFDHRGLTFRTEPNAHPASSIDTTGGRTVQQMFSLAKVLSTSGALIVGENNIVTGNTTQTLPSISGLAVGSKVEVYKASGNVVTVQCNNITTEQIRVGNSAADAADYDSFVLDTNSRFVFTWTGTVWECNF
jgi:phage-related tail fiber protein